MAARERATIAEERLRDAVATRGTALSDVALLRERAELAEDEVRAMAAARDAAKKEAAAAGVRAKRAEQDVQMESAARAAAAIEVATAQSRAERAELALCEAQGTAAECAAAKREAYDLQVCSSPALAFDIAPRHSVPLFPTACLLYTSPSPRD